MPTAMAPMKSADHPFIRRALLQEPADGKVRCKTCERRCEIVPGGRGWCRTRENRSGTLVILIYGAVSFLAVNPVEKKPFYHFHPGTLTLTAGSWSCNFACPWCQNWDISKTNPPRRGDFLSPEKFVELVHHEKCNGTSISFNEPTLSLEWSLEVFRLARRKGLYNTYVTNGYMTPESLSLLIEAGLDAMNVDVKGEASAVKKFCGGIDVERIWALCGSARSRGVHLEITTLVIPGVNDEDAALGDIALRIVREIGQDVPWHVTAYRPAFKFKVPATPLYTLERAYQIGKEGGLEYFYTGNVPGHPQDHTYCPQCGVLLIQRCGFDVVQNRLRVGHCPACGRSIAGVWGGI
jgi:pyruvate formate lyase activating enzyme